MFWLDMRDEWLPLLNSLSLLPAEPSLNFRDGHWRCQPACWSTVEIRSNDGADIDDEVRAWLPQAWIIAPLILLFLSEHTP